MKFCIWSGLIGVVLTLSLLLAPGADGARHPAARLALREITIPQGALKRHFVVHIPPSYGELQVPLVLVLHGAISTASSSLAHEGWLTAADRYGFMVAGADAVPIFRDRRPNFLTNPQVWNTLASGLPARIARIDDVGFIAALLDYVQRHYRIDPRRIYVTGFSSGASMSCLLGLRLSARLAAIAPVTGHLFIFPSAIADPLSVLYIIGEADPLNPIAGGYSQLPWGWERRTEAVEKTIDEFRQVLGCPSAAQPIREHDGVKGRTWAPCRDGAAVEFYTVEGLGHVWPGADQNLPARWVGAASKRLDATELIWRFFAAHPKAQAAGKPPAPNHP